MSHFSHKGEDKNEIEKLHASPYKNVKTSLGNYQSTL